MKTVYVVIVSIIVLFGVGFASAQTNQDAVVDRYISSRAKAEGADEYRDARKILSGDVNGDGKADLVVLYTLEGFGGGNSHAQYLAVFAGGGKTYRNIANTAVGGKMNRDVELTSISGGKITLDTLRYAKNDPTCCPSKKGKTRYAFAKGKLWESK